MTGDAHGGSRPDGLTPAGRPSVAQPSGPGAEIILDQPLDGNSLYQLRASVAAHANQAGLPRRRADDLVIAAHELAANVIRHGSGSGRVRIWRYDQMLHCQVTDDGDADPAETAPPTWRIEPGHGLWLVRQLADSFSLHPGRRGSAATVSFALSPVAAAAPFTLSERDEGASTALQVAGQLDLNSAEELTGAIDRLLGMDPAATIVVDLEGLTFWDAFGLAGLLRAQDKVQASEGAAMVLARVPTQLAAHLRETGLAERLNISAGEQAGRAEAQDGLEAPDQPGAPGRPG
jgi:anti-anti-sigma factor